MHLPSSFIKNVAIPLRNDYEFSNSPWKDDWNDEPQKSKRPRFIGRRRHIDKLKGFLARRKGVFLVTGYRGMGKTSFVNHTIGLLKAEQKNDPKENTKCKAIISVHLTIAQQRPAEIDLLRQVVISIYDKLKEQFVKEIFSDKTDKKGYSVKEKLIKSQRYVKIILTVFTVLFLFISILLFLNVPGRSLPSTKSFNISDTSQKTGVNKGLQSGDTIRIFQKDSLLQLQPGNSYSVKEANSLYFRRAIHYMASKIWYRNFLILIGLCWLYYFFRNLRLLKLRFRLADDELFIRVKWMAERAFTSVSEDMNDGAAMPVQVEFKGIKGLFGAKAARRVKGFPVASSKELEYELRMILEMASIRGYEFIFVFDELDKIDFPEATANIYQDLDSFDASKGSNNFQSVLRNRKQAVMSIIAGLKNFFTTAEAAFIFIAGREMFDASLADISDKQSPLSSIFTYTFNIESFLKEEEGYAGERSTSSITNAIEEFIKYQLCTREELENDNIMAQKEDGIITDPHDKAKKVRLRDIGLFDYLKQAYDRSNEPGNVKEKEERAKEFGKIYFTLQAFVSFLAYRSNGSPKKILKSFHEFVRIDYVLLRDCEEQFVVARRRPDKLSSRFLVFNYHDQCRTGFINYLYRPFLVQHGRSFKLYSDNAVISVPYLFDHLFKFHSFAFSRPNLELVPELLSSNKTPSIKEDLDHIIGYLSNTHLRETNIELFEYKFNSRSSNEISFLSRVFEEEAAAFNFTLDESYAVKLLLNEKIKELRSIYAKFQKDSAGGSGQIYSIAYHNGNLGDLHFFDQEYDDAIGNYSDAIRPINHIKVDEMNLRDFVTLVRNKLKIGLCLEKVNSYEEALSFFTDAAQDAQRFITFRLQEVGMMENEKTKNKEEITTDITKNEKELGTYRVTDRQYIRVFKTGAISNLLQIVIQSTLANTYLQEKVDTEGMTGNKIKLEMIELFKLSDTVRKLCGQNFLQTANFFFHLGRIAYFKNSGARLSEDPEDKTQHYIPRSYVIRLNRILKSLKKKSLTDESHLTSNRTRQPTQALIYYIIGLDEAIRSRDINGKVKNPQRNFHELHFDDGDYNKLSGYLSFLQDYLDKGRQLYTASHYKCFAGLLTSIGDCLMSLHGLKPAVTIPEITDMGSNNEYWKLPYNLIFSIEMKVTVKEGLDVKNDQTRKEPPHFLSALSPSQKDEYTIADVLRCYYLAARYYKLAGRMSSSGFEYKKILHTLRVIACKSATGNEESDQMMLNMLKRDIVDPARAIVWQSIGRSHRHMILKSEEQVKIEKDDEFVAHNIASHPETREIVLLYEYISLKAKGATKDISKIINPYNSIATQFTRILELNYFAAHIYYSKLRNWLRERQKFLGKRVAEVVDDAKKVKLEIGDIVAYLFSNQSLIHSLRIYGPDYMLGHSFTAYSHYRIASFLRRAELHEDDRQHIMRELNRLMGVGSKVYTDAVFHYGMAHDHYVKAIELHTAGDEYRQTVKGMIFLEDDFSDNASHFGAALDRYMLVRKVFDRQVKKCLYYKKRAGGLGDD